MFARRFDTLVAVLILFWAALSTVGGLEELIIEGILHKKMISLWGCSMGLAGSALALSAGIALLRQSPRATALARAAILAHFLLLPLGWSLWGWPMRIIGVGFPLFLLAYFWKRASPEPA
jgi:hypothetical protein